MFLSGFVSASALELKQAVIVVPPGLSGPESKAVQVLIEEVAKRTQVQRSIVPWLEDATLPIPHSDALAAAIQRSVMTAGIGSLVDGTRTMTDIACALSESWGAPPDALMPLIRAFLSSNTPF